MLEHSIFQTEVQFNAPTTINDQFGHAVRGNGPFQTKANHRRHRKTMH